MFISAKYYIAQLVPDVVRREANNIGIIVVKGHDVAARFIGERELDGSIDKRSVKFSGTPDVYAQWIDYWRRLIKKGKFAEADLFKANGGNFNLIFGGDLRNSGNDPASDVVEYLYPLLVSEGGLIEALGRSPTLEATANSVLKKKVGEAFDGASILDVGDDKLSLPLHPVRREVPIQGKRTTHRPAYSQNNGHMLVMEVVDFTQRVKSHARDHAGLAAIIFTDIQEAFGKSRAEAVAIVQIPSSLANDSTILYGLDLLEKTADRIVNWSVQNDREKLIAECVENSKSMSRNGEKEMIAEGVADENPDPGLGGRRQRILDVD